jgi:hypothetical protein
MASTQSVQCFGKKKTGEICANRLVEEKFEADDDSL